MSTLPCVKLKTVDSFSIGQRLDNYLIKYLKGVPKSHIYRIIRKGEVRVNGGKKKVEYKLQKNDIVRLPPVKTSETKTFNIFNSLQKLLTGAIIYEDSGLVAINKPSGLAVHSGSGVNVGVIEAFRCIYKKPIELVHRLDRATSGVLLLAKKRSVLKNLHAQLNKRQVEKHYVALVNGAWAKKTHTIDMPLFNNLRQTIISDIKGKKAISHFRPVKNFHNDNFSASLVEITIKTGRTHQIRAHAKYAGHSIAGDAKYGDKVFDNIMRSYGLERLFLHAEQLIFTNPETNKIQKIKATLSKELTDFLNSL